MLGQRRDKSTRLKLNTTNIELKYKPQATDKTKIQRDGADTAHHAEIDRHVKWHRSKTTRLKKRPNNEGSGDHWFISSVRPRPSSDCSVTQMPKTIAFMSKSGKISTDLRRRVRPATADICGKRPEAARGGTYHNENGKRLSHSAGFLRMKERLGANGAEMKVLKPSFEIKETKTKDAWASNVKKENRIISNIEDDRNHKSVNQTPELNQDKPDNIINLEQDDNADIVVAPNETKTFTGKSDKSVVRDQMAGQAVPFVAIIFEDENNACKDTDRERLELETIRERKVELKVNKSAGIRQPEESEMLKIDENVSLVSQKFAFL